MIDETQLNALVHDLRNELTVALLQVDLKCSIGELPLEVGKVIRNKLFACVEKIDNLSKAAVPKTGLITVSSESFFDTLKAICRKFTDINAHVTNHATPESQIFIESVSTLDLIVGEILRNASKVDATQVHIHISETPELIKIFFRDNGMKVVSWHKKDLMSVPGTTRGHGGEGVQLLNDLALSSGGAISWHPMNRGLIVKLLLQKKQG